MFTLALLFCFHYLLDAAAYRCPRYDAAAAASPYAIERRHDAAAAADAPCLFAPRYSDTLMPIAMPIRRYVYAMPASLPPLLMLHAATPLRRLLRDAATLRAIDAILLIIFFFFFARCLPPPLPASCYAAMAEDDSSLRDAVRLLRLFDVFFFHVFMLAIRDAATCATRYDESAHSREMLYDDCFAASAQQRAKTTISS